MAVNCWVNTHLILFSARQCDSVWCHVCSWFGWFLLRFVRVCQAVISMLRWKRNGRNTTGGHCRNGFLKIIILDQKGVFLLISHPVSRKLMFGNHTNAAISQPFCALQYVCTCDVINKPVWVANSINDIINKPVWVANSISDIINNPVWVANFISGNINKPVWVANSINDTINRPVWVANCISDVITN